MMMSRCIIISASTASNKNYSDISWVDVEELHWFITSLNLIFEKNFSVRLTQVVSYHRSTHQPIRIELNLCVLCDDLSLSLRNKSLSIYTATQPTFSDRLSDLGALVVFILTESVDYLTTLVADFSG